MMPSSDADMAIRCMWPCVPRARHRDHETAQAPVKKACGERLRERDRPASAESGDAPGSHPRQADGEGGADTGNSEARCPFAGCRCVAGRGREPRQPRCVLPGQKQAWASPRALQRTSAGVPEARGPRRRRRLGRLRPLSSSTPCASRPGVSGPRCRRRLLDATRLASQGPSAAASCRAAASGSGLGPSGSAAAPSYLRELAPLSDSFCKICAPGA